MNEPLIKTPVRYDRSTESILDAESWSIATVFMNDPKGEHIAKIINQHEALIRVAESAEAVKNAYRKAVNHSFVNLTMNELELALEEWRNYERRPSEKLCLEAQEYSMRMLLTMWWQSAVIRLKRLVSKS